MEHFKKLAHVRTGADGRGLEALGAEERRGERFGDGLGEKGTCKAARPIMMATVAQSTRALGVRRRACQAAAA